MNTNATAEQKAQFAQIVKEQKTKCAKAINLVQEEFTRLAVKHAQLDVLCSATPDEQVSKCMGALFMLYQTDVNGHRVMPGHDVQRFKEGVPTFKQLVDSDTDDLSEAATVAVNLKVWDHMVFVLDCLLRDAHNALTIPGVSMVTENYAEKLANADFARANFEKLNEFNERTKIVIARVFIVMSQYVKIQQ
jgi:hypothetical protein